jgi:hypothetical protein
MVHYRCRLDAAVAIRTVEIQCVGATFAERAIIDRYGCVISHSIIVVTLRIRALDNRCATLEREAFSLAGIRIRIVASGKVVCGFSTVLREFPIGREESRPSRRWWQCRKTREGIDFESALGHSLWAGSCVYTINSGHRSNDSVMSAPTPCGRSLTSMRRGNNTSSGVEDVGRYHLGSRPSGRRPGVVAVHGLP